MMRKIAKTKRIKTGDEMAKQRLVMAGFLTALFVILTLIAVLFAIIEGRKSVSLDILVAPKDAVITLNGERYKNGEYRVEPGEYEVSITREGLEPYYKVVDFADGEDVKMYLYLTGVDGDMSWYLTHSEDDMIVTSIGDYYANKKSQEYAASDPIFAVTPYYDYDKGFKVNAAQGEDDKVEVIIYLYTCDENRLETLKENAHKWLNEKQIDLEKYKLSYKYCD